MSKKIRKRKCAYCNSLFSPDYRNRKKQKYCSEINCKKASKANSQKKWSNKIENKDIFRGNENVSRVQDWRKKNPNYSRSRKNKKQSSVPDSQNSQDNNHIECQNLPLIIHIDRINERLKKNALQDDCQLQPVEFNSESSDLIPATLQDDCLSESPMVAGIIAYLTGNALQDNIEEIAHSFRILGETVLSNACYSNGEKNDNQEIIKPTQKTPITDSIQLD